jgi:hypothetical protein
MQHHTKSIRPFIGAKDFNTSRNFYSDLGFQESNISASLSYFKINEAIGFYLQNAFVEDWINNSMVFVEVNNVEEYYEQLQSLNLAKEYPSAKLVPIRYNDWGCECFLHDPAGILWHFGAFK